MKLPSHPGGRPTTRSTSSVLGAAAVGVMMMAFAFMLMAFAVIFQFGLVLSLRAASMHMPSRSAIEELRAQMASLEKRLEASSHFAQQQRESQSIRPTETPPPTRAAARRQPGSAEVAAASSRANREIRELLDLLGQTSMRATEPAPAASTATAAAVTKPHVPLGERAQPREAEVHLKETLAALQRDLLLHTPPLSAQQSTSQPAGERMAGDRAAEAASAGRVPGQRGPGQLVASDIMADGDVAASDVPPAAAGRAAGAAAPAADRASAGAPRRRKPARRASTDWEAEWEAEDEQEVQLRSFSERVKSGELLNSLGKWEDALDGIISGMTEVAAKGGKKRKRRGAAAARNAAAEDRGDAAGKRPDPAPASGSQQQPGSSAAPADASAELTFEIVDVD